MPEGDTIHRAAARLRPVLQGHVLERFEAPRLVGARPRAGEVIEVVEAVGKHLMVRFSGGLTLDTHMRMTGTWQVYRVGEPWRRAPHLMRCMVAVHDHQAVCFSAPVVRTFPTARSGTIEDPVAHLGPDLCLDSSAAEEVVDECVDRMVGLDPATPIGEVLLDQRVGNGIGNVYKSDVCWHEMVDPFAPLSAIAEPTRRRLISTAGRLLRANLGNARRRTVPEGLAVYGRSGQPCRRCGAGVRSDTRGELARITYWCPRCQYLGGRRSDGTGAT